MPLLFRPASLYKACLSSLGLPLFLMCAYLSQACLLFFRPASLPHACLSSLGLSLFLRPASLLQAGLYPSVLPLFIRPVSISVLHPGISSIEGLPYTQYILQFTQCTVPLKVSINPGCCPNGLAIRQRQAVKHASMY